MGYYVLSNSLTALTQLNNALDGAIFGGLVPLDDGGDLFSTELDGDGGNYFRSLSPYRLESFAVFGEGYFDVTDNLQLTVGLRYTDDQKEQDIVPTFLFTPQDTGDDPLASQGLQQVSFEETTGRIGFDWSPDLSWSEDTLLYGFYSRGYKGGGINPPQPAGADLFPADFAPEFIDSYEIGAKNTLAGGLLQLNASAFMYDYEGYQITQIVNRTSANFNIDAELQGLELEATWSPVANLILTTNIGLLDTEIKDSFAIDVLDRANGRSDLVVLKNAVNFANCVVSAEGYAAVLGAVALGALDAGASAGLCTGAFEGQEAAFGVGDVTYIDSNGVTQTVGGLTPFDGEAKDLDGNSIPGAPESTLSFGVEYTWGGLFDGAWDLTARGDYYYQADSFSRVWNTGRDALDSWDNVNLALVLANTEDDWTVELFGKNITDEEVITGAYLTDDSSGLFTNIFLTEPQTYGISLSKSW
ncbi:MAG: TonB-dependent receptor [Pseudomonadota bacterium]